MQDEGGTDTVGAVGSSCHVVEHGLLVFLNIHLSPPRGRAENPM